MSLPLKNRKTRVNTRKSPYQVPSSKKIEDEAIMNDFNKPLEIAEDFWETIELSNKQEPEKPQQEETTSKDILRYERGRLLKEVRIPLNPSQTKFMKFGLDPFKKYVPTAMVCSSAIECGPTFTCESLRDFLQAVPDALVALRSGKSSKNILLVEHTLEVQSKMVCLRSNNIKTPFVNFGEKSLKTLHLMTDWFINILNNIGLIQTTSVEWYIEDLRAETFEKNMEIPTDEMLEKFLIEARKTNNHDQEIISEMIVKFPKFLKDEVRKRVAYNREFNRFC